MTRITTLLIAVGALALGSSAVLAQAQAPAASAPPAAESPAPAAKAKRAPNPQAQACVQEGRAQGLKGAELKAYRKECLGKARAEAKKARAEARKAQGKKAPSPEAAQCNQEGRAQGLKGDDLRNFRRDCIRKARAAAKAK